MDLIIQKPNEKQELALKEKHKHVGYGGARGGGKSWFIRTKAKLLAMKHKGIRMLIVRRTYPELEKNHISQLKSELVPTFAKYNKSEKKLTFITGSVIEFMYCRRDDDLQSLQGAEYDVIFIDEATQLTEYQLKTIGACCRGTNSFPKRVYYTCNPGGQGHGYIKRIFIDKKYEEGEYPEQYAFIQAFVQDNKALMEADPEYIKQLELLPPKIKEAWLYGSWDVYEGQFFEDFVDDREHYQDRLYTHVIDPFDIPLDWKIYRSYDFGYAKPFSIGWWAVDYDNRLYRILEWYGCTKTANEGLKLTPDEQFKHIAEIEASHPYLKGRKIQGVADPSIWDSSRGESVADTAIKYGIYFTPGDNARINGWMQMHYRFMFDRNGIPMMYFFNTCKGAIRTIPLQMYSETNYEDLNTDLEDHAADEIRYMCMNRPISPTFEEPNANYGEDPLNQRVKRPQIQYKVRS